MDAAHIIGCQCSRACTIREKDEHEPRNDSGALPSVGVFWPWIP